MFLGAPIDGRGRRTRWMTVEEYRHFLMRR